MDLLEYYYRKLGLAPGASMEQVEEQKNKLVSLYSKPNFDGSLVEDVMDAYNRIVEANNTYEINYQGILDDYIRYGLLLYSNYDDPVKVVSQQINFFINGQRNTITRDCRFRDYFMFLTPEMLLQMTNYNIEDYVNKIDKAGYNYSEILEKYLINAIMSTYNPNAEQQIIEAINLAYSKNDFSMFDGRIMNKMYELFGQRPGTFVSAILHILDNNAFFDPSKGIGSIALEAIKEKSSINPYKIYTGPTRKI